MKPVLMSLIPKSFRSQLIYGIGLFLTLLISLFIYVETINANTLTRTRGMAQASEHSAVLASMVKTWVMSNDYAGLEEALENFSIYDDLTFAAVINMDGKIIAHTDTSLVGKYIADTLRVSLLQSIHKDDLHDVLSFRNQNNVDVFNAIHNGDEHIGLVHLRFDQHVREELIRKRIYAGVAFGLLYLSVTVLLLFIIVNTFTKQLGALLGTMKKVHEGDKWVKADESGENELSQLSHEFNTMLDAIASGEVELKRVKERLEYAIIGANDGIWDWNLKTGEVYFSPRWKEMIGYSDSELPNLFETWEDRLHPDDIEEVKNDITFCHSQPGRLYVNIHRLRHKDGSWVWILARGQTIFDEGGKAIRMVGFHTDITQQKKLEQELAKQEEMMIAQSRHVAMGEMIGMIAHQWRQPITVIAMGANNILLDIAFGDVDYQRLEKEAKEILHQTEHLSKTIDDFRNFFRSDKEQDETKIVDILLEAKQIMGKSLEYHAIALTIESDETKAIRTHSRELLQVFLNILKNAQEAIEQNTEGHGYIDVRVKDGEDLIVITMDDNGGGVEESLLNRIFEPYFTTKGKQTGTGLGLYMSKTIIEKHLHGTITAKNTDHGVQFIITIPKQFNEK